MHPGRPVAQQRSWTARARTAARSALRSRERRVPDRVDALGGACGSRPPATRRQIALLVSAQGVKLGERDDAVLIRRQGVRARGPHRAWAFLAGMRDNSHGPHSERAACAMRLNTRDVCDDTVASNAWPS